MLNKHKVNIFVNRRYLKSYTPRLNDNYLWSGKVNKGAYEEELLLFTVDNFLYCLNC